MDILICKILYPNDPTKNISPHQHFVSYIDNDFLILYSISSIFGKEYKAFNNENYIILGQEQLDMNLKAPSFIDCSKSYKINIKGINIYNLNYRFIPEYIKLKILNKISTTRCTIFEIDLNDFKKYNKNL